MEKENKTFTFTMTDKDGGETKVTFKNPKEIVDIIEHFEDFLVFCGYELNGWIDLVSYESSPIEFKGDFGGNETEN